MLNIAGSRRSRSSYSPGTTSNRYEGAAIVAVLLALGRTRQARDFAYDLLRRHFSDFRAHRAFRDALLRADQDSQPEPAPDTVGPGVAVAIKEPDAGSVTWAVIEDSAIEAHGVENELAADSPMARLLLGRRAGDEVNLSEAPGLRRSVVVTEIVSKLTFRARDLMDRWQHRFPDKQEMWMVRVSGDDGRPNFDALFAMVENSRKRAADAVTAYMLQLMPVAAFARLLGKSEVQALACLADEGRAGLRCCKGSAEEFTEGTAQLAAASEVVIDLSALVTLLMLEELRQIPAFGKIMLISHSTLREFRAFVADAVASARSGGSLVWTPGGPRFSDPSEEQRESAATNLGEVLAFVEANLAPVSSIKLAYMDAAERKQLTEVLGLPALESVAIASEGNRILWTDDGVLSLVAKEKMGVRRMWSQLAMAWLLDQGRAEPAAYERASSRLIAWGYSFTRATRSIMKTAGALSEWSSEEPVFRAAVRYLGLAEVRPDDAIVLAAGLIADAYWGARLAEVRNAVLSVIMSSIDGRPDVDDRALNAIGLTLSRAFGLNVLGYREASKALAAWRAARLSRVMQ